jgi:hypothetical protein
MFDEHFVAVPCGSAFSFWVAFRICDKFETCLNDRDREKLIRKLISDDILKGVLRIWKVDDGKSRRGIIER